MKKTLIFILLITLSGLTFSQPYRSIFGQNKTCWNISFEQGDFYETDSLKSNEDTIINSLKYKIISQPPGSYFYQFQKYYVREDTNTGKYYIRSIYEMQHEYLFMDMGLNVGDTFIIHNKEYFSPDSIAVVDSVYLFLNRKAIKTNLTITTVGNPPNYLRFYEAVGPNNGINYLFQELWSHLHFSLLCQFKDDTLSFHNPSAFETETCHVSGGGSVAENNGISLMNILPNPFEFKTILRTNFMMKHTILTLYNSLGQAVKQLNNISGQSFILSRDGLPAGMYFIRLTEDNKTLAVEKIIISD